MSAPGTSALVPAGEPSFRASAASHVVRNYLRGCEAQLPADERLLLTTFTGLGFMGSTSLSQLLMSSQRVATLCNGGGWECETKVDNFRCTLCENHGVDAAGNLEETGMPCLPCRHAVPGANSSLQAYAGNLAAWVPYWAAQDWSKKSILSVKWAPIWPGVHLNDSPGFWPDRDLMLDPRPSDIDDLTKFEPLTVMEEEGVPKPMRRAGIKAVRWAVVLMHRPWCMWRLSDNNRREREANKVEWARDNLLAARRVLWLHELLRARGIPVWVVSYAQLLWEPTKFIGSLGRFLPCIANDLDVSFVPKLDVDFFKANDLKTTETGGTIAAFAKSNDPWKSCRFDVATHSCFYNRATFQGLNRTEVALAKETEYKLNVLIHQTMRRAKVIDRRFGGRD